MDGSDQAQRELKKLIAAEESAQKEVSWCKHRLSAAWSEHE